MTRPITVFTAAMHKRVASTREPQPPTRRPKPRPRRRAAHAHRSFALPDAPVYLAPPAWCEI